MRNESPTIAKILAELKRKMDLPYKKSHLHSLLMKLGFKFKRRGMERIIYERDDLVSLRGKHSREKKQKYEKLNHKGKSCIIVIVDKTWLIEGHRLLKEWVDLVTLNKANRKLLYNEGLTVGCTKPKLEKENASLLPMQ